MLPKLGAVLPVSQLGGLAPTHCDRWQWGQGPSPSQDWCHRHTLQHVRIVTTLIVLPSPFAGLEGPASSPAFLGTPVSIKYSHPYHVIIFPLRLPLFGGGASAGSQPDVVWILFEVIMLLIFTLQCYLELIPWMHGAQSISSLQTFECWCWGQRLCPGHVPFIPRNAEAFV